MEVHYSQNEEQVELDKLTLNQLNSLLSANQKKPDEWTPSRISEHYQIKTDDAGRLFVCLKKYWNMVSLIRYSLLF